MMNENIIYEMQPNATIHSLWSVRFAPLVTIPSAMITCIFGFFKYKTFYYHHLHLMDVSIVVLSIIILPIFLALPMAYFAATRRRIRVSQDHIILCEVKLDGNINIVRSIPLSDIIKMRVLETSHKFANIEIILAPYRDNSRSLEINQTTVEGITVEFSRDHFFSSI